MLSPLSDPGPVGTGLQPDLPFRPPLATGARPDVRGGLQDLAFIAIRLIAWGSINALAVLGCTVAAFLVISGGEPNIFFAHVENLASRFGDADPARQSRFAQQLVQAFWLVFVVFSLVRAPALVRQLRIELASQRSL